MSIILGCVCGGVIEGTLLAIGVAIAWLYRKVFRAGAKKKLEASRTPSKNMRRIPRTFFIATEIDGMIHPIEKVEDLEQGLARRRSKQFITDHPECVGIRLYVISLPH